VSSEFEPRFGQVAEEFQRYRPDYPSELFGHILDAVPPEHRRRAMDLGAGTGKATRALMPHFAEVIAVEPDAQMAAKLAEQFPGAMIRNVPAERCSQPPETVDLVTIANALHWMEAERVFANVRSWLRRGGVLAVFDRPLPKTTPALDAVLRAELRGPWKPHRDRRLERYLIWQKQVRAAPGLRVVEETKFPDIVPMSARDLTGYWRSTSYASAYARTLADPELYWRDLESRIAKAAGKAVIPVDLTPTLALARKV
jgi:SAM-dependent methyltransferase